MLQFELTTERGYVQIILDVQKADEYGALRFEGNEESVRDVRAWLGFQTGAYGHFIGEVTTPADLQAVMARHTRFKPRLVRGEAVEYPLMPPGVLS